MSLLTRAHRLHRIELLAGNASLRVVAVAQVALAPRLLFELADLRDVRDETVHRRETVLARNGRTIIAGHRGTQESKRAENFEHGTSVELHRSHDRPSVMKSGKAVREPHLFGTKRFTSQSVY